MRTLAIALLCSLPFSPAIAQAPVTLRFARQSRGHADDHLIHLRVGDQEVVLSDSTASVTFAPDYTQPVEILVKQLGVYTAAYALRPTPHETYQFLVEATEAGISIVRQSGQEATPIEQPEPDAALKDSAEWQTELRLGRDGRIAFTAEKEDPSEALRQRWMREGGRLKSTSTNLIGTLLRMEIDQLGVIASYGGGLSMYENYLTLRVPRYRPGISTWNSFIYGYGADMIVSSYSFSMDMDMLSMSTKTLRVDFLYAANIGWTLGVGKFLSQDDWRGVALLFRYRPTVALHTTFNTIETQSSSPYVPSSTVSQTESDASINLVGFGFDIQFSNFTSALEQLVPRPTMKLSFFFLPPVNSSPLYISVSVGILFYDQRE